MRPKGKFDLGIVGAGPTGLTLAYRLAQDGLGAIVVDRNTRAGGLSRSHCYDGSIFDIGPKRFHTEDPKVVAFIHHVLGERKLTIGRSTKVFFADRYFDWPLRTRQIARLPLSMVVQCLVDLLTRRGMPESDSLADYVRAKYGNTMYEAFFKPYTEKFLRMDAENVHSDWARTGINRSILDKKAKVGTLIQLVGSLLLPESAKTGFLYPSEGGFGGFWETLKSLCEGTGLCEFLFEDELCRISKDGDGLACETRGGEFFHCGRLAWTGNLNDLMNLIEPSAGKDGARVAYLNTIFYNLVVDRSADVGPDSQWIYISDGSKLVSRVSCMNEFAAYTSPDGHRNLVCEVTDSQANPAFWMRAEDLVGQVVDELVSIGLVRRPGDVRHAYVNRERDTYPVYHRAYLADFGRCRGLAEAFSDRLLLMGRSGAFWYNNSDHSMRMALEMADFLAGRASRPLDYRGYFGGSRRARSPVGESDT